jgi:hypothetical protein
LVSKEVVILAEKHKSTKFILKPDVYQKLQSICKHDDRSTQKTLERLIKEDYFKMEHAKAMNNKGIVIVDDTGV